MSGYDTYIDEELQADPVAEITELAAEYEGRGVNLEAAGAEADQLIAAGVDPVAAVSMALEDHDLSGLNELEAAAKIAARRGWS